MLPVLCGIVCAVLVLLDAAGKLHPERTHSQILLYLFSLLGTLTPLLLASFSPGAFLEDAAPMNPVFRALCTLPSPVQWVPIVAMICCAMTWGYTLVRTCSCVPVFQTGSTPKQAAKQQLTMLWFSLPFFLLMLMACVVWLACLLSIWWMSALTLLMLCIVFLPAVLIGALMMGYISFWMLLSLLPFLIALLIPYVMGVVYGNRYLIACAPCLGWKKPWRIFLQVVMFLPWLRWIVTAFTMAKMQKLQ